MEISNPIKLLRYVSLTALLLFSGYASSANDKGLFWLAQKDGHSVYLLGSVHLASDDFYPLRKKIQQAYKNSDVLVVEADILAAESDPALQQKIMQESLYLDKRTLRDDLSPAVYSQLQEWLQKHQLPEPMFIRQRPAIAMITMSMMELKAQGLNPGLGIDRHFLQQAKQGDKPVIELEGVLQQLRLLNQLESPDLLMQQTLEQLDEIKTFAPRMVNAWKNGDADRLYRLIIADNLNEHPEFKPLYETLFFRRNRDMAKRIIHTSDSYKSQFVIIGAGHLVGEHSVIELLQRQGYNIEQL
ncbi:TraB/GumN family protein [Microbulbifer thermotolerans]|uniref:TraB/GumN family protein n=1 Tax=Microbulbifer thermotolerans TaxID=252514 RepID=UPI00224AEB99|nr:TraB/GumN family protein [Microbulbifer thermotolerans]MCX2781781.1 TraB/GumN family protein [Microbulbifer thermotolerans]